MLLIIFIYVDILYLVSKYGILIRGLISDWTKYIVEEYKEKFPDADIVISTWDNQDVSELKCKIIQNKEPPKQQFNTAINRMIVQIQKGLECMNSEIILQCRTDQIIHNKNIFKIFEESCQNKIMVPLHIPMIRPYYTPDYCQLATKDILSEFWSNMHFFDGKELIPTEEYLIKQYVTKIKKDTRSWENCQHDYFCYKGFFEDFKIEWYELANFSSYRDAFLHVMKLHSIPYEFFLKEFIRVN